MTYVSDAGFMWPTHVPSPREKNTLPTVGTPIRAWLSGGLQLLEGAHGDVTGEAVKQQWYQNGQKQPSAHVVLPVKWEIKSARCTAPSASSQDGQQLAPSSSYPDPRLRPHSTGRMAPGEQHCHQQLLFPLRVLVSDEFQSLKTSSDGLFKMLLQSRLPRSFLFLCISNLDLSRVAL